MPNEDIAKVLAAIIALGLALQSAVGPVAMYITEAIKSGFKTRSGLGGVIATLVSVALGAVLGALTASVTVGSGFWTYTAFGAVAGLFIASGAIKTYSASGSINTEASAAINATNGLLVSGQSDTANWGSAPDWSTGTAPTYGVVGEPPAEPIPEGEPDYVPNDLGAPDVNTNEPRSQVYTSNAEAEAASAVPAPPPVPRATVDPSTVPGTPPEPTAGTTPA